METKNIVRQVFGHGYDWCVLYFDDKKIWEGHDCNVTPMNNLVRAFGGIYKIYEFTDQDEIDGCTPDKFSDIIGIKMI